MPDLTLVDHAQLSRRVVSIFVARGLPAEDAWVVTDNLVDADLRGVHSHGVWRVAPYVQLLCEGKALARPTFSWVRDEGPQAVLDAATLDTLRREAEAAGVAD